MARLTILEKDMIARKIQDPILKELNLIYEQIGVIASSFIKKHTPEEVLDFHKKYPDACNCENYIYSSHFNCFRQLSGIDSFNANLSIPLFKGMIKDFHKKFEESGERKELNKFIPEIIRLNKLKKEIKGKTRCVLEDINTYKQLKDQFPEAYEILQKENNKNLSSEERENTALSNKCDSIEGLRAQLSQFNNLSKTVAKSK